MCLYHSVCPVVVGAAKIPAPLQVAAGVYFCPPEFPNPMPGERTVFSIISCPVRSGNVEEADKKVSAVFGLQQVIGVVVP